VIHEFDPWFNFRATKYLAEHGWHEFFHWFDYKVGHFNHVGAGCVRSVRKHG